MKNPNQSAYSAQKLSSNKPSERLASPSAFKNLIYSPEQNETLLNEEDPSSPAYL